MRADGGHMVMVSHAHKLVFLKTRKTAGTSIEMFLQPLCTDPDAAVVEKTPAVLSARGIVGRRLFGPGDDLTLNDKIWFAHMSAAAVRRELGDDRWGGYRKIASIRNPFDRMISQFHYRHPQADLGTDIAERRSVFRHFVLNGNPPLDDAVVCDEGAMVVDHFIRFENLTQDLSRLWTDLDTGLAQPSIPETKMTAAKRGDYTVSDYFDDDTIAWTRENLAWNFRHGNYVDTPHKMVTS